MPYADRTRKNAAVKRWRSEVIPKGYGRWLYQRRKLRFDDAERFRMALQEIKDYTASESDETAREVYLIAARVLLESRKAEEALGPWVADDGGK